MLALRVKARVRVRAVVDDLQLPRLVIVAVPAVQDPCVVSLLVSELPVIANSGVVSKPAQKITFTYNRENRKVHCED